MHNTNKTFRPFFTAFLHPRGIFLWSINIPHKTPKLQRWIHQINYKLVHFILQLCFFFYLCIIFKYYKQYTKEFMRINKNKKYSNGVKRSIQKLNFQVFLHFYEVSYLFFFKQDMIIVRNRIFNIKCVSRWIRKNCTPINTWRSEMFRTFTKNI